MVSVLMSTLHRDYKDVSPRFLSHDVLHSEGRLELLENIHAESLHGSAGVRGDSAVWSVQYNIIINNKLNDYLFFSRRICYSGSAEIGK